MSGMFWIALELSNQKLGLFINLFLLVHRLTAFKTMALRNKATLRSAKHFTVKRPRSSDLQGE